MSFKVIFFDKLDTLLHMLVGMLVFVVLGYYIPQIYYHYFDKTKYYKIYSPLTIENKTNLACSFVDAYVHRVALIPIKGTSVKQLTLLRIDKNNMRQRIASYTTDIQAEVGESTVITHWQLPCVLQPGTYLFEGIVEYQFRDIKKYESFFTENFDVVASNSAKINDK